jgi:hypothetical protein
VKRIYTPTTSREDWKPLLAQPELHWKVGRSAMSLATVWEGADGSFPGEVQRLLLTSAEPRLAHARLLLGLPEYTVQLPGGSRPTQTDLLVVTSSECGPAVIAVEGKVDESFGPTLAERSRDEDDRRLAYLYSLLEFGTTPQRQLRYQLLHRTAAALLMAKEFGTGCAAMIVHSFSPDNAWSEDYLAFAQELGAGNAELEQLIPVGRRGGIELHLGWVSGTACRE